MSKIYLFGGIGCGENIFERMSWPEGYDVRFVGWKEPLPGEDFSGYCARIVRGEEFMEHDILFGVSLGGIAALEIAGRLSVYKNRSAGIFGSRYFGIFAVVAFFCQICARMGRSISPVGK